MILISFNRSQKSSEPRQKSFGTKKNRGKKISAEKVFYFGANGFYSLNDFIWEAVSPIGHIWNDWWWRHSNPGSRAATLIKETWQTGKSRKLYLVAVLRLRTALKVKGSNPGRFFPDSKLNPSPNFKHCRVNSVAAFIQNSVQAAQRAKQLFYN